MKNSSQSVLRLIDANMNRAVEGIRVMEESARMFLDNEKLTSLLKTLRHQVVEYVTGRDSLFAFEVLAARGSDHDVLRSGETKSEATRESLLSVVRANAGRAEEALRSIEEYIKLVRPSASEQVKSIRFSLYDLEKDLVFRLMRKEIANESSLRFVVVIDGSQLSSTALTETALACIANGIQTIAYRNNSSNDSKLYKDAELLSSVIGESASFIIFNRPDICLAVKADGCHLENGSLPPETCRYILDEKMILGGTLDFASSDDLNLEPFDYVVVQHMGGDGNESRNENVHKYFAKNKHVPIVHECLTYELLKDARDSGGRSFMTSYPAVSLEKIKSFSLRLENAGVDTGKQGNVIQK